MFSITLNILVISPSARLREAISDELREHPVELEWLDSIYAVSARSKADAALLETEDLEDIRRLKSMFAGLPVFLICEQPDYQWGLAGIREGASEYLCLEELHQGRLFRALRFWFERSKVERALEQSQAQLLTAQRMEAIGRTVAGVAHDFRHFLQVVYGNCGLMKRLSHSPALDELVDETKEAAERASLMIKQMLEFAQGNRVKESLIDLNGTINDLAPLYKNVLGPGVDVQRFLCEDPLLVSIDSRIEQCLMNLIINANDAIGRERGVIFVETRRLDLDRDYVDRAWTVKAGAYAVLEVSDSGHGIEPKDFDRIFEPFFTTKPRGIGTGLGLSSVFTLMKEWKGSVTVASRPGLGTTFKLLFPLTGEPEVRPLPKRPLLGRSWLLWEPDPARYLTLRRDLSALGGEVAKTTPEDDSPTLTREENPEYQLQVCDLSPRIVQHLQLVPPTLPCLATPFARHELATTLTLLPAQPAS